MQIKHSKTGYTNRILTGVTTGRHSCLPAPAPFLLLVLLLSILASFVIGGCGSGSNFFDGGHVPIGGNAAVSRIVGLVYDAENSSAPVPNATVLVTNTLLAGPTRMQTVTTGANGSFDFPSMSNPYAVSRMTVLVTPKVGSDRQSQQLSFPVQPGQTAHVMVALPSISFDQTTPAAVSVSQVSTISAGDSTQVTASLLSASGAKLPVTPSLIFIGTFGTITPDGLFTSAATGTGVITAYWDTGSALLSGSSSITVDTQTIHKPPPPPVVPPSGG